MKIGLLGPLEVTDRGAPIEISGQRLRLLLTVLALDAPRAVSLATLVEALWGASPPTDESNALQSLISRLRRTLGAGDLVQQAPGGYRLAVEAMDVDVQQFGSLARAGHETLRSGNADGARALLADALALWRGAPQEVIDSGHGQALLARLSEQHLDAQADLIEAQLALGAFHYVISDLEGLVAAHPLRERFAVLLVKALNAAGRPGEALASYERTKAVLADELGTDPSPELRAAHLAVLQSGAAPPPSPAQPRSNLRATLTSFVGRDEQLAQIATLMRAGRLVTLVGPGGAGKTRLAGAAAGALTGEATGGVWLIELAPVTDPSDVPQTVLGSLGLRDAVLIDRTGTVTPRDATSRLIDSLRGRAAVLVLDNCEHLVDAIAQLTDQLLAQCPDLRVLATSREPLGIFGEALLVVPPLGQPNADADAEQALDYPAVRLFADRAADVQPGFIVTDDNVANIIEIVRRLDGLPLAIELAAARLRSLPVAEIERRLSDRFRLLTGGSRTAMPRHRTLRAVVEWSWDLLTESEQHLAERLAVFSGGITPEAALAICAGDLDTDVDDLLASLVDKSLLQVSSSPDPTPRYRMLETIREFGLERMATRGEVGTVRGAHAVWFSAFVFEADTHLRCPEQLEWMARLDVERDNILAALRFLCDDGRAAAAIALVNALGWYWMTISSHGEIVTWTTFALAVPGDVDPGQRLMAEAYLAINTVAWNVTSSPDDVEQGMANLQAVSLRMADPPAGSPKMLTLLAPVVAMFTAADNVDALVDVALTNDDPWIVAAVRTFRAAMAENDGDIAGMRRNAELALATFRQLGERWGMANSLQVLGQLEMMEGHLAEAAAAYGEGLDLAVAIGSREDIAMMRLRLADILTRMGDTDGAFAQAELARDDSALSGSAMEILFTHIVEVEIARASGDVARARAMRDDAIARLRELPSAHPIQSHGLAVILATAAKIDLDDGQPEPAREHLVEAYAQGLLTKDMPMVAAVGVGVAMLAEQLGFHSDAAEILGATAAVRGAEDRTQSDVIGLMAAFGDLDDGPLAEDYRKGRALCREDAVARLDPASLSAL